MEVGELHRIGILLVTNAPGPFRESSQKHPKKGPWPALSRYAHQLKGGAWAKAHPARPSPTFKCLARITSHLCSLAPPPRCWPLPVILIAPPSPARAASRPKALRSPAPSCPRRALTPPGGNGRVHRIVEDLLDHVDGVGKRRLRVGRRSAARRLLVHIPVGLLRHRGGGGGELKTKWRPPKGRDGPGRKSNAHAQAIAAGRGFNSLEFFTAMHSPF